MRNRMYGGVRGRKTKVGEKLLRFPPTRLNAKVACSSFSATPVGLLQQCQRVERQVNHGWQRQEEGVFEVDGMRCICKEAKGLILQICNL